MKKCAFLFLVFVAVLVLAALVENNQAKKDTIEGIGTQELTLSNTD